MRMNILIAALALAAAGSACALDIQLPPETATYKPSELPGYQLVQRNCMTCHAAQYASSQPPASPRAYWEATVKKMKKPFGAQFADADVPAMVDYLVKTYGAERGAAATVAAAAKPAAAVAAPSTNGKDAKTLLAENGCMACHALAQRVIGPGFAEVAARYKGKDGSAAVAEHIRQGGSGKWGAVPMPPFSQLSEADAAVLAKYVLSR
ncbi:SorB family sulfite dehydrogenase c-type cytochrome subunit [Janthinobacterium sp. 1_2014MBL_MicDiv]|uniref:SorB family sulfite dehydrogenase c-type cytochrome subunit n=1 Tax=Janthinobacterium sp. 1_2014MBL_MicDiv TaxID=1644131 RepID=UPI0008F4DC51|nr:c-type cytochrome [Janthinobacterium sp. 1_2014MBL_MicDiv]APA69313.1 cytochrome C552 [Janthinobacterium sp. 1_2014MBL_MicDiv]